MKKISSPVRHNKPFPSTSAPFYFIGIGGIGMSALARYYMAQKGPVEGSDSQKSSITDELIKEGVRVKIGQKTPPKGLKGRERPVAVIYNRAIPLENPELEAFRSEGVPLIPYAEALGEVTREYDTIAITGSHGKSTTTALAAVMLMRAGFDPTVLVGTKLADLGGRNVRIGGRNGRRCDDHRWLVLEADDYQAAFLHYSPSIAIVTNIDREHMDFYKTFGNVQRAFLRFLGRTREGGMLILNKDDAPLASLRDRIMTLARNKKLKVVWYSRRGAEAAAIKKYLTLPGAHNLSNAAAVYALGRALGIPQKKILGAFHAYRGAWRRMEYRGTISVGARRVKVFDDYAHHPTEIKATIAAFREKFPHAPLLVAFQPHQAKRLAALFDDFQSAFAGADVVWIAPIYAVRGRDEAVKYDSAALVRAMQSRPGATEKVFSLEDMRHLGRALRTLLATPLFPPRTTPVLVMMGAGNIVDATARIMKPARSK